MKEYNRVPTSYEVWKAIKDNHPDLCVFASYSAPLGCYGNIAKGEMFTSYGFPSADYPTMEARTTWDIEGDVFADRKNEKHEYWLCLPIKEDGDGG